LTSNGSIAPKLKYENGEVLDFGMKKVETSYYNGYDLSGILLSGLKEGKTNNSLDLLIPKESQIGDKKAEKDLKVTVILSKTDENSQYAGLVVSDNSVPTRKQEWREIPLPELKNLLKRGKQVVIFVATGMGAKSKGLETSKECNQACRDYLSLVEKYGQNTDSFFQNPLDNQTVGVFNTIIISKD
jgi:hypothetical protein